MISRLFPPSDMPNVVPAAQGGFKRETLLAVDLLGHLAKHNFASLERCAVGIKGRKPPGDQVGIEEIRAPGFPPQELLREGGLS
jgi:hypothetical protein